MIDLRAPGVHRALDRAAGLWSEVGGYSVGHGCVGRMVAVDETEASRYRAARSYRRRRDALLAAGRERTLSAKAARARTCRGCGDPIPAERRADATWCERNCRRDRWRERRRAEGRSYT